MIAECTACEGEFLSTEKALTVSELNLLIKQKHPKLEKLSYKIAINQTFVPTDTMVLANQEIALLPPFSGG